MFGSGTKLNDGTPASFSATTDSTNLCASSRFVGKFAPSRCPLLGEDFPKIPRKRNRNPFGSLTLDAQGNVYGTTRLGGANNDGTVFEITNGSSTITTLASFNGSNGRGLYAGVTLGARGNMYGTTAGDGVIYEITKGSGTITTLATFGTALHCGVTLDGQGNLYGTKFGAGANDAGSIWEIANGSGTITTLASFDGTNGSGPVAGLTLDSKGNLFGTTNYGGDSGVGTVFELTGAVVPEPASILLQGAGILLSVGLNWTRKSR